MPFDNTRAAEAWLLTPAEHDLVMTKNFANRLGFALLLLFYKANVRFPRNAGEIDPQSVSTIADQLGIEEASANSVYNTAERTWKRHRAELRALFGFREATVSDGELLEWW